MAIYHGTIGTAEDFLSHTLKIQKNSVKLVDLFDLKSY